jgi:hypothetical protein
LHGKADGSNLVSKERSIMKKLILIVLTLVSAALVPALARQSDEQDKEKVAQLMQKKLKESQKVLEGVATGKFDLIARHAENLSDISKQAEWRAIKSARYELYSNEFQRTTESLIKHAKEKNLDAAALAYVELTLNCVKCHKYVREVRMVRLDPE